MGGKRAPFQQIMASGKVRHVEAAGQIQVIRRFKTRQSNLIRPMAVLVIRQSSTSG